jgi:hypothetical protein
MKRLIVVPMRRHYFLLSFLFSRLVLLAAEVGTLVGFSILLLKVPVRGSWLDLTEL